MNGIFVQLDLPILLTGLAASLCCALLGNLLVLRRMSLVGDAISHAVLPGLVVGMLVTGSRGSVPMLVGAAIAGIVTVVIIELVVRLGKLERGAAMGVVFSIMFALGVLLLEQAGASGVDLDPECVLYGDLDFIGWEGETAPTTWGDLATLDAARSAPRVLVTLMVIGILSVGVMIAFFKELRLNAFDPGFAKAVGLPSTTMDLLFLVFVAAAIVASFEAVGAILVIAMLICPAATARLLTDRLGRQIVWSLVLASVASTGGYLVASFAFSTPLKASGVITIMLGLLFMSAAIGAPRHGVLAHAIRTTRLRWRIREEDLLANAWRAREQGVVVDVPPLVRFLARRRGLLAPDGSLTTSGQARARDLVRTHRLWESYLVDRANMRPDHVHRAAMDLEHYSDEVRDDLSRSVDRVVDPHDRPIPSADE